MFTLPGSVTLYAGQEIARVSITQPGIIIIYMSLHFSKNYIMNAVHLITFQDPTLGSDDASGFNPF